MKLLNEERDKGTRKRTVEMALGEGTLRGNDDRTEKTESGARKNCDRAVRVIKL